MANKRKIGQEKVRRAARPAERDQELRLLQRRARAKMGRIRAAGGNPQAVASLAPVHDWKEVINWTSAAALTRYKAELRWFTSRKNQFTVVHNPEGRDNVIERGMLAQTDEYVRQYNLHVRTQVARINRIKADGIGTVEDRLMAQGMYNHEMGHYVYRRGMLGGALAEYEPLNPPKSRKSASKRWASARKMATTDYSDRRQAALTGAVKSLYLMGEFELGDLLQTMTEDQLDVLFSRTNFWAILKVEYVPTEDKAGFSVARFFRQMEFDQAAGRSESGSKAEAVVMQVLAAVE